MVGGGKQDQERTVCDKQELDSKINEWNIGFNN